MGAQLKIESEEAVRLATELAGLRGESIAVAVTAALRQALERDRRTIEVAPTEEDAELKLAELREIVADIHAKLPYPRPKNDHGYLFDYLYDDYPELQK